MRISNLLSWGLAAVVAWAADVDDDIKSISPYLDSDMQSRWYDFGGDTVIRTDQYIRLTADRPSQMGWIFSRVPLTATNWQIEVEFKIHGTNTLFGDGFAMWLTKERGQPGPVFGSVDKFEGLGIFFDTYKNNRPGVVFPFVMAMVGDGKTPYDKDADGKANELAGCSARGIRGANIPTLFRLTYFQDKSLKLELQYKNEGEWTLCFETSDPPTLPPATYLGFSAETGELSDNHDLISVAVSSLYGPSSGEKATPGNKGGSSGHRLGSSSKAKKSGGWLWFFTKIILFVLAVGGGYVGYTAWRTNKRSHRF
ncbi:lectin, mannose-binding protein 2 [Sporothrix brasiliensis 5110]|uniref:Lectin, mannose-binding protein 2 n=1 Tax=Sporothrix brasiliensis 5110 TaxID=1398154 RepID=A0A0C2FHR8_9PEZI|nr:lectin, mannose-binding protein 2 [Sporothrix brasiliensis 5110]KIH90613.1 lectin, mannose-binding protein 2 [Sporothrix brasiliensis 5110]